MGPFDMNVNTLVRWTGEANWHFVESVNHGTTACNIRVPFKAAALEYCEIEIRKIISFKGTCKKCFHEMCIEFQDPRLWEIYYTYIAVA
jgi:hypothetical protein